MQDVFGRKPYLTFLRGKSSPDLVRGEARDGTPIPLEKGRPTCSAYAPGTEADRMLAAAEGLKRTQILVILGAGNPQCFGATRTLLPGQICVVVDHRLALGALYIEESALDSHPFPELEDYLRTPGCHAFFGAESQVSLEHYLEGLPAENFQGIRFLKHRASVDRAPDFYADLEIRMRAILQSRMSDLLTRFEFEPLWLRNTLLNSMHASGPDQPGNLHFWQDRFAGTASALLVSAGPSLTETIPWIQKNKDQFFILACDTALKPLLRAGIRPHGVHILDAQKQTMLHFQGEELGDLIIFADLVCHPSLPIHLRPGGWIFSSTARLIFRPDGSTEELRTPGTDQLEQLCGPQGRLQSGGSVATSAFDLLRFLGFRTIYFAGQDLAWTNRQLHALGTHHYERWNNMVSRKLSLESINERVVQKRDLIPVQSVDGRELSGDFILSLYRSWFEQSIEALRDEDPVQCINLSRGGAFIHGMHSIRLADSEAAPVPARAMESGPQEKSNTYDSTDYRNVLLNAFGATVSEEKDAIRRALQQIYDQVAGLSANSGNSRARAEQLWQEYPDLRALIRKTEVYISRNQEKLSEDRSNDVYERNLKKTLREFLQFASRYISNTN
ncbi:MAG: DUF115 domain-containing protein [Leptospiraceae bacterium]|nr:DUF115 domain-containing protein [Leptospiraceae bacterium]